ncbi:DUF2931 family protein [Flavobacterium sp. LS1R49]|uniref:DUF2931 family protein n=1 Tax=Flavobacterium shii TaxID=2987687 RepID=A0A9X3C4Y3_9FLAO|nr:DUF2931 family protein [Flavobacterium shii]MCV9929309.1 DUF2931 family protein [Flavobacterium shii]
MEDKKDFSWAVTVTAPFNYPIEIHKGYLGNDKKMIAAFISTGLNENGWNYDGDALSGGNTLPTLLSLTWISYAEKKFWKIETSIDQAVQNKMIALFKEGYMNKDREGIWSHLTYKNITVGLAPGGTVVLWLTGKNRRVEVAHYQAKETFVSVDEFYRNPHEHTQQGFYDFCFKSYVPKETQAYIKEKGVPVNLWNNYRTKYKYHFNLHFYKADKENLERYTKYVNGEEEKEKVEEIVLDKSKALPEYVRFYFNQYNAEAEFDGEEILAAFKKISKNHPDATIEIEARVAFMYKTVVFTVKCGGEEIPLEKVTVRMWKNKA